VQQVVFSPDSRLLASVALDGVILWEVAGARRVGSITSAEEGRFFGKVAFSSDGTLLAATTWLNGNEDGMGEIRIFETATGRLLATLAGHLGLVTDVAFSPNSSLLASTAADGTVRLWGVAKE
jgi:WD40 repeat protein